jgi:hypothetical protein
MHKKITLFFTTALMVAAGCATFHSLVKSTFPYKATLTITPNAPAGTEQTVTGTATSFDQDISKDSDTGARVKDVRVVAASLTSKDPSDFNIGNLVYVKIFIVKPDGTNEIMVASRTDITPGVGNSLVLDAENSVYIDAMIRQPKLKIRMAYKLRNQIKVNVNLKLVLGINASPGN